MSADQPGVRLLAVRRARRAGVAQEVHVRAAGRRVGGRLDDRARPADVRLRLLGVAPAADGVEHVRHRALGERRVAVADPGDRAAHLVDVDLALRPRRRVVQLDQPLDQLVVEAREVRRLEVGVHALLPQRVDQSLDARCRASGPSRSATGSATARNVAHVAVALLDRPRRGGDERRDLAPVPLLRDHRQRRRGRQVHQRGDVIGRARRPVAEAAQQVAVGVGRVEDRPGVDHRADRVQRELELRDDAEVAAAAAQAPEAGRRFSLSLAWTSRPSAVTTSAPTGCRTARPYLRISQPMPPPSVKPATPVVEIRPPVVASPCACVSWSTSAHTAPPPTVARRAAGSTWTSFIGREVDDDPAVARSRSRRRCGRRRARRSGRWLRRGRSRPRRSRRRRRCSGRSRAGRRPSCAPFQILAASS